MAGLFPNGSICAVVVGHTAAEMRRALRLALREARTIELRLDWLRAEAEIQRMIRWIAENRRKLGTGSRATLIATCRRVAAGGKFRGSVARQIGLLRGAAAAGCAWLDLEIESAEKISGAEFGEFRRRARVLVSFHDFRRTPADLRGVSARLACVGGDAIKIAAQAAGLRDALRVLETARSGRHVVAVPMGDAAAAARILALRAGSTLAYAPAGEATAPGQISFEQMRSLYRADRLTRRTRVYGGDRRSHRSFAFAAIAERWFSARRMDAVYVPLLVRDLRDFLAAIGPLGIAGFSVTLPHKEAILRYLDDCDPLASQIGAVNTVVVRGGGKLYGYNTDYVGVLRALERRLPLAGSRVLVLGAGGSARAVAFALARAGANVRICARRSATGASAGAGSRRRANRATASALGILRRDRKQHAGGNVSAQQRIAAGSARAELPSGDGSDLPARRRRASCNSPRAAASKQFRAWRCS